ncbi:MAG TPA: hypothetical protein PLL98_06745 [Bacillota bacterium]|nr:hypothetical protein [Bacillota bacterium]
MTGIIPSILLEDSKSNRYFFYYKDSSICYREISAAGDIKDTILISQANADFAAALDTNDTICLTCNSRYKGVLLFTYSNGGWKFETIVNLHNSSDIYIMDMVVQNGSIHIFFSKKLSLSMCNVYHLHRSINEHTPYIDYSWRKNSLSEIYPQNMEDSYSLLPLKNGIIHYASVWYDGAIYCINYYCFDDSVKSWLHKSLNFSYKNQVFIKLISHNKKINLFCFSNENGTGNIRHFVGKSGGGNDIDFKDSGNIRIDTGGVIPLFYYDDKAMQLAWIKDNILHQYIFDDSTGKWKKAATLPITAESSIYIIRTVKNSGQPIITKGYFFIDENFNISKPIERISKNTDSEKSGGTQQFPTAPNMNDYLKQILSEIKDLSDNVQFLKSKIDDLESSTFVQKSQKDEKNFPFAAKPITAIRNESDYPELKKSGFKDKFMRIESTPSFDSISVKQDNINTYIGKPATKTPPDETSCETKGIIPATDNEKQAFVSPGAASRMGTDNANASKSNALLKRIGEYFK